MTKVLLITGGGRGIGAATALTAARHGWDVAVNYRMNRPRAEAIVDEIENAGGKALAYQADISNEDEVAAMFAAIDHDFGPMTGLVNSAGILGPRGRVDELETKALPELFAVNVTGILLCCREAIRRMSRRRGGSGGTIVNLSSVASRLGGAGESVPYAASKGAVDSLTFGLAQEVVGEGIRINAVRPGVIDTEIQPPGRVERLGPNLPMKRAGKADEVASAILYLLSDDASYVSGAVFDVSGGR